MSFSARLAQSPLPTHPPASLLIALLILLGASIGCKDKNTMPDSAQKRAELMGNQLPKNTDLVVVASDLAQLRSALVTAEKSLGDNLPMAAGLKESAQDQLGVDLTDAESFKKAGIEPNGGISLAVVNKRPVLLTWVTDKKTFEDHLTTQINQRVNDETAGPATLAEALGDEIKVKIVGDDPAEQVGWTYAGKMVIASFPPADDFEGEPGPLQATLEQVATAQDDSLANTASYRQFSDNLARSNALAVFVNTGQFLSPDRMKMIRDQGDDVSYTTAEWVRDNVRGSGLAVDVSQNRATVTIWAGFDDAMLTQLKNVTQPPSAAPFANLATANTLAGLRMSVNWDAFWKMYNDNLPAEQRDALKDELDAAATMAGGAVDLQTDVLDQLSGNLGLFFYGASLGSIATMGQPSAASLLPALGLLVGVEFKSPEALDALLAKLMKSPVGNAFERRPLRLDNGQPASDVEVLTEKNVKNSLGTIYLSGASAIYGPPALSEQSVYDYIKGSRQEGSLAKADGMDLGAAFATGPNYNGLYLNVSRAKDHLLGQTGDVPMLAPMIQQARPFLDSVQEISLDGEVTDQGGFLRLSVDVNQPAPNAPQQ